MIETPKSPVRSKTIWGAAITAASFILIALGYSDGLTFLADGIQAEDIPSISLLFGWVLTQVGHRTAKKPLR